MGDFRVFLAAEAAAVAALAVALFFAAHVPVPWCITFACWPVILGNLIFSMVNISRIGRG